MTEHDPNWLRSARDYLQYQVNLGVKELVLPPAPAAAKPAEDASSAGHAESAPLTAIRDDLGDCTRCPLHKGRQNLVFGEGAAQASLMFVGEGPGRDEDRQGLPFVGRAGRLLTKMIAAMTLDRQDVYIANIVKCRPPDNRDPGPREIAKCLPFLDAQIDAVKPKAIVALGRIATQSLLETSSPLKGLRGRFHDRKGIPVMPTFHPSFLLRFEEDRTWKARAWSDLRQVMALLNIPAAGPGGKQ